ncbi:MAG: redoxin family protein [Pseudolysinimonas sp.]
MPQTIVPPTGTRMTDIELVDSHGRMTTLDEARNGRRAVIFFLRASDCPICIAHSKKLVAMATAGELGDAALILVAPGDAEAAAGVEKRVGSDTAHVFASRGGHADVGLGVFLMLQHSGTFVLDETATILMAMTSPLPTSSFSASKVRSALGRRGIS